MSAYTDIINSTDDLLDVPKTTTTAKEALRIADSEWMSDISVIRSSELSAEDARNRYFTTVDNKVTDTSVGGAIGCNPKPSFCRYTDPPRPGRLLGRNRASTLDEGGNYGMGTAYSLMFDDTEHIAHFTAGFPKFANAFDFYSKAIDRQSSYIANTGRPSSAYTAASWVTTSLLIIAFPVPALFAIGLGFLGKVVFGDSTGKFYTMKEGMHVYWGSVNTLTTIAATEEKIVHPSLMRDKPGIIGTPLQIDTELLDSLRSKFPNLITKTNYIDVYAIINRGQIRVNRMLHLEREAIANGSLDPRDYYGRLRTRMTKPKELKFADWLDEVLKIGGDYGSKPATPPTEKLEPGDNRYDYNDDGSVKATAAEKASTNSIGEYIDSTIRGGVRHASFRVSNVIKPSDNFSNSYKEIPAKEKFNAMATGARDIRFSLSNGNIMGETIAEIGAGFLKVVAGTLDTATLGVSNVISAMITGGKIEMPKMWDASTVDIPSYTLEIDIPTPYNNGLSRVFNAYIPINMLLGLALPIATGRASHTSPPLVSLYIQGVCDVKMGMVTGLKLERATANLPYAVNMKPLGFKATVTVTDFNDSINMPVNSSVFGAFKMALDEGNYINNYMATLAGRDLNTSMNALPKIKLRAARALAVLDTITSSSYWGTQIGSTPIGSIIGAITPEVGKDTISQSQSSSSIR